MRPTIRQFTLAPGKSFRLGSFKDGPGNDVTVTARVRTCDEDPGGVDIDIDDDQWEIVVPPGFVAQVPGLREGANELVIAVVAGECKPPAEPAEPKAPATGSFVIAKISGDD